MAKNQSKKTAKSCQKWPKIVENGQNWSKMASIQPEADFARKKQNRKYIS